MESGIELIAAECRRQSGSGNRIDGDDILYQVTEALLWVAVNYVSPSDESRKNLEAVRPGRPAVEPWDTPVRELVRAGMLIAAAIDRMNADVRQPGRTDRCAACDGEIGACRNCPECGLSDIRS